MWRSTRVPVSLVASWENTFPNPAFKHDFKHIGWVVFQLHAKQAQLEKHQDVTFQIRPYSSSIMGCFYLICQVIEHCTERGSILNPKQVARIPVDVNISKSQTKCFKTGIHSEMVYVKKQTTKQQQLTSIFYIQSMLLAPARYLLLIYWCCLLPSKTNILIVLAKCLVA